MNYTSGRVDIAAVALSPIHHGAGTKGNTTVLRMQEFVHPTSGELMQSPFISGNSIKHTIRQHAVEHALEVMGVEDGTLSKQVVDLLFSGGHLSKAGAAVSLSKARELAGLFPVLGLCGYSAGNTMTSSKVRCSHWHLLCEENAWRAPAPLQHHKHALMPADDFRGEEFGTRHEATRSPRVAGLLKDAVRAALAERVSSTAEQAGPAPNPRKGGKKPLVDGEVMASDVASSQMIYDFEVLKPGARLYGNIQLVDVTPMELAAFQSALSHWCARDPSDADAFVASIGAKNGTGFGEVSLRFTGTARLRVDPAKTEPSSALAPQRDISEDYQAHLRGKRADIIAALEDAVS